MGNKISTVGDDVKRQGEGSGADVYTMVDLKGGGELVEMMKRARWTKNFKEIDDTIQEKVKKFLYNGGRGEKVHISKIIELRNKTRSSAIKAASKDKQRKTHEQALLDLKFQDSEGNYLQNKPGEEINKSLFEIITRPYVTYIGLTVFCVYWALALIYRYKFNESDRRARLLG